MRIAFKYILFFLFLWQFGGAQNPGVRASFKSKSPFVWAVNIDTLAVQRQNVAFTGREVQNYQGSTFEWMVRDTAFAKVDSSALKYAPFTLDTVGLFDVNVTVDRTNLLSRYFARGLKIRPPPFAEGDADVVLDLSAIQAGTFTNPLGDASIAGNGTNNFAYDFDDVSRPGLKIYVKGSYSGRINITGLRGTAANPVRIQGPTTGQAVITATNGSQPYALQFTTGNQYIEIDGSASATHTYAIKLEGYIATATSGQVLFFSGSSQKGFWIHGVEIDGRRGQGSATGGGAALQFQPPTPDAGQNASNYSQEYIIIHNCYIHNNFGEGIYVGYFSDAEQAGFRPDRMGYVFIFDNVIEYCFRDGIQWASTDYFEIFRNRITNVGEEANASHISAFSLNDGNLTGRVYQNYVEEADLFMSAQNGDTGTGNYYVYSNYGKQRDPILAGTGNQFVYFAVDDADCDFHFFNNTIKCNAVVVAPVAIQHNNLGGGFECLNFTFAGNLISTSGTDQATWPELRRVNTPANTSGWFIDNVWRRTADEAQLKIDSLNYYRIDSITSPAFNSGFDWETRFASVFDVSNHDRFGYSTNVNSGYTAGADAGYIKFINDSLPGPSGQQVILAEIGTTSGTVGVTQRASTGTLTPPLATTGGDFAAGDLLVCMASIRATGGTTDISGWTQISTHRMGTTSNGEFYIWGKIADGTETGSVTVTFPNDFVVTKMARCFRFKYNNTTSVAAAVESINTGQATSNTYAAANVTSTVDLALAVQFVAVADDNATGSFTGESGGDYTEDATYVYSGGTGGAHSVQTAELATAGSITGGTFVMAASDPWGVIGLIIKPQP